MTITVQNNKVINKRLYKQDLSGVLNCCATFSCVEPGLYLAVATIIPPTGVRWSPSNVNGTMNTDQYLYLYNARSFTNVINVTSTCNVSIPLCGCMCVSYSKCPLEVQSGSVVFLKQM